tara:strand:- start:3916 stop:4203 length:288 start_codon:yes stop_codon:yes gene_type:complete
MDAYTRRRMRELRGEPPLLNPVDPEANAYTSKRLRELQGEKVYWDTEQDKTAAYCTLWIREHKLERQLHDRKLLLDNRKLGSYTVSTMGDRNGET